ncbi:uncharacterized protein OCT59_023349 [Rhizophagus irregularis]|uniref:Uncharacterized protein n=1 Tax=Rhizophagus irregularis (strain DAOM 181602 / DAOM 197198 / MUCL 43194) TaxID=747089 RepID=A0A2H5SWM0_RHIID|nr:hypothetical protein GLOIN_2v1765268 [Rhizophagus irregularis DAOM 181602=DAOM 197198]POG79611.1 hypothetical protein GLOIN_2v1765268 [Rhizophagus irregularis DAOM 181602=DAOM 197198]UZO29900.1 hypothetical protein OCT59_023349 [Rhizophagus irregularis]CAG8663912.1 11795_t:CDS:2 [Rhizophagus irregularis]|eukprot:XP_025186477.1 hypothetical protein GLOIN_2v1765268 [Rhizophagus irregularis DAOM 181602=DAOM 197198]
MILQVTHASNRYSISDSYKIQIRPLHCIQYGENFNEQVFFKLLATNAADLLYKKFTENKAKISGILLFGLQLNKLKEYQEMKSVKLHAKILKLVKIANDYYLSEDVPLLESIEFSIKGKGYDIDYGKENQDLKYKKEVAIVKAIDKSRISRDGYRYFMAIESNLPKECARILLICTQGKII